MLARSRTINFYNEFIEKNKELSSIMCGGEKARKDGKEDGGIEEELEEEHSSEQE